MPSDEASDIGQVLYKSILDDASWKPFGNTVTLSFTKDGRKVELHFDRVHFLGTRQCVDVPGLDRLFECEVHYAAIHGGSKFLENFMAGRVGFDTTVILYDANREPFGALGFERPRHFSMFTDAGCMDVIFDDLEVKDSAQQRRS